MSLWCNLSVTEGVCACAGRTRRQYLVARCLVNNADQEAGVGEVPDFSLLDATLQKQWDHRANAHLGTVEIKPDSTESVAWVSDQCPDGQLHSWSARVASRTSGSGCPLCEGRKVCKHNSSCSS